MDIKRYLGAAALAVLGLFLVLRGIVGADWLSATWLDANSAKAWWLTPYSWVTNADAYNYLAKTPMILGGVFAGLTAAMIIRRHARWALLTMFTTIVLSVLGFNTFDYLDAYIAGSSADTVKYFPVWNFNLNFIVVTGWDFYFFFCVVPLFVGGMLISLPLAYVAVHSGKCD
jgi:hypothetical protein